MPLTRVARPPVLDGRLDDACWRSAAHVDSFVFPVENRPATEPTEAWVCADAQRLYVAIRAHDAHPDQIVAQQPTRGGSLQRDDHVALMLDPTGRFVDHYQFEVSALGTQNDVMPLSGSGNFAWRGTWDAAAARTTDGYCVEMSIPLALLHVRRDGTVCGIGFKRWLVREKEASYWPAMRDRFLDANLARLGALHYRPPAARPAVFPWAVGQVDGRGPGLRAGIDAKHTFSNSLTALATVNPDFKNVEDVVDSIAFTYTERYLNDPRPFFREGGLYYPEPTAWYTRRIPSLSAGAKAFAGWNRDELGTVACLSGHGRVDGAAQYVHRFDPLTSLGGGLVYREAKGDPDNLVAAGRFRASRPWGRGNLYANADAFHSVTDAQHDGQGNAAAAQVGWGGNGLLGWRVGGRFVHPTYKALDGYVPDADIRGGEFSLNGGLRTQSHFIQNHTWYLFHNDYHRRDGQLLNMVWSTGGWARFDNGMSATVRVSSQLRRAGDPERLFHDKTVVLATGWGLDSLYDEGYFELTYGRKEAGDYAHLLLTQGWSPVKRLRFNVSSEYTYLYYGRPATPGVRASQNVGTATWDLTGFSSLSARFIERHGALNLFLAYRLAPLSGRSLYLFFGDPNALRTRGVVQAKVVWPL